MLAILLCIVSFAVTYYASRRSLATGIGATLTVGYFYGIIRANVPQTYSHFIFDAAVVALYVVHFRRPLGPVDRPRTASLRAWMFLILGWPLLLFLIPIQPFLVQVVGLRGSIFLVAFVLLGARLTADDIKRVAMWCAVLNLVAFGFALLEYFYGVEAFYPRTAVTEIIYRSRSVETGTALRIPATFSNAHSYAGMMVTTLPILIGVWLEGKKVGFERILIAAAVLAACLGVFMAATRLNAILLFLFLFAANVIRRVSLKERLAWTAVILVVGYVVAQDVRLQRFRTLEDVEYVTDRVSISVNETFFELAGDYPLGNGLGGGGTSMPYFLQGRVRNPVSMENEYAHIMLEQGIPGLVIWVSFLVWLLSRRFKGSTELTTTRRLAWWAMALHFATGFIGAGLLTAIPMASLLFLLAGWVSVAPARERAGAGARSPSPKPGRVAALGGPLPPRLPAA